jgi:RNA polymerase sigma-70 factor (ECF subfamily)
MLSNDDDARDVVQALFIDLLQKGTADVDLAYLYRAVTHRCLNVLRDERTRSRLLEREQVLLSSARAIAPDEAMLGLRALSLLESRVDREVMETLVFRYCDDMGLEEIADVTGVSRKTVSVRLRRAELAVQEMRERGEA